MNTLTISNLHQLLDYDAEKLSHAEIQLKSQLPGWIKKAGSPHLKPILQQYLVFIEQQIRKFQKIGAGPLPDRVMEAFLFETNRILFRCSQADVRDACLVACLQEIIHFKISRYGTAAEFASTLAMQKISELFHESERIEKKFDDQLSQLAEGELNIRANTPILMNRTYM